MRDDGPHRFIWYELMTTEPDAAVAFYREVVGWGAQPFEGWPDYTLLTLDGSPLAGAMKLSADDVATRASPHWVGYVGTRDVDATLADAERLGATVALAPMEIPGAGRVALFRDPHGALIGVYAPLEPVAAAPRPRPGDVGWHELATGEPDAAWHFYRSLFGWRHSSDFDMGGMGTYRLFATGGEADSGGIYRKPASLPGPPAWLHYFAVADVADAARRVEAHGGTVAHGPMAVPGGDVIAQCFDPHGALFALHERRSA